MKLSSLPFALAVPFALAGLAPAAHAQGAIYITPVASYVHIGTADNSTFSFLGPNNTSRMFYGVNLGGFYDIPLENKRVEVGIDLRDSILHGNNALLNSFFVGPRIAAGPALGRRFHPYVEPVIGAGTTRAPNTAIKVNKVEYGVFVGGDYDLNRHVTFRVAEVGFSSLSTASASTIGVTANIPSATIVTISSGLTLRLP